MTKNEIATALEDAMDTLDTECREQGHIPHPWVYDEPHRSHTACKLCGHTMVVRVYDGHTWKSGLPRKCEGVKQ